MEIARIQNVLITDEIDQCCINILQQSGLKVSVETKLTPADLLTRIKDFDALIVRSSTKVTKDVIKAAGSKLKLIGRAGTGVDNIDMEAATEAGILVMNTPAGNSRSVAELTCGSILNLSRKLTQADASLKQGRWDRKSFMGIEVYGRTLAIIGLGRIGREVAARMQPFGMKLIGFDPLVSAEESKEFGVEWLPLDQIWPRADFVSIHVPFIPQTENLINAAVLEKCKKGVFIINNSRGGIVNEKDILEALENGRCGGTVIDSFVKEPPTDFTLAKHKNAICTPHIGASTIEAQKRVAEEIAEQIVAFSEYKKLCGNVNGHALLAMFNVDMVEIMKCISDSAKLLKSLGHSQKFKTITATIPEYTRRFDNAIKAAISFGLVQNGGNSKANLINANVLTSGLGLKIILETHHENEQKIDLTGELDSGEKVKISTCRIATIGTVLISLNGCKFPDLVTLKGTIAIYETTSDGFKNLIEQFGGKVLSICCAENDENQNGRLVAVKMKDKNEFKETSCKGCKLIALLQFD